MKTLVIAVLLFSCSVCAAKGTNGDMIAGLLVTGRHAGACSAVSRLTSFQAVARLKGGDDFMERFIKTESALQDLSPEDYLKHCFFIVKKYAEFMTKAKPIKKHCADQTKAPSRLF